MAAMAMGQEMIAGAERPTVAARRAASVERRNRELLEQQPTRRRGPTPEMFFTKHLDNSRLKKEDDPVRKREMWRFTATVTLFGGLLMVYVAQHLWAINVGRSVEEQKQTVSQLREENRQLRLSQAKLTDPERLDAIAQQQLGMGHPLPGQVVQQDGVAGLPVLAEVLEPGSAK